MEPTGVRPNDFGDGCSESDNVVFDFGFDLENPVDIEICALADGLGRFFGHDAGFGQSLRGRDLDRQPGAEAVFVAPDAGHFRPGIAWDHGALSLRGTVDCKSQWALRASSYGPRATCWLLAAAKIFTCEGGYRSSDGWHAWSIRRFHCSG